MNEAPRSAMSGRIEAIESSYEFMLAYAAQGREGTDADSVAEIRRYLSSLDTALDGISENAANCFSESGSEDADYGKDFLQVLNEDAGKSRAAIGLVLGQERISSQIIDNLNASIHLRALLTDIFLLDEVLS